MAQTVVLLHGFAGSPDDFAALNEHLSGFRILRPDLSSAGPLDGRHSFAQWTQNFVQWLAQQKVERPWLVGYSQGGRLAMHVAALAPQEIRGVLAVSSHPGIFDVEERQQRQQWEQKWIEIFATQPLPEALAQWQEQEVFVGTQKSPQAPASLSGALLGDTLANWSATRHEFAPSQLLRAAVPVEWVVGARDQRYVQLLTTFLRDNPSALHRIEDAGHRVHLDAPWALAQRVLRFTMQGSTKGDSYEKDIS